MSLPKVEIENFEGPLDLLLQLIEQQKIDVHDIPVAQITEQYLEIIKEKKLDLEEVSDFMVMASRLLALKARILLPPEKPQSDEAVEEEEDPRRELVERLLEYKQFKKVAELLTEREAEWLKRIPRAVQQLPEAAEADQAPPNLNLENILRALYAVLQSKPVDVHHVKRERLTVQQRMQQLEKELQVRRQVDFAELFERDQTRSEVVVTFLALLELCHKGVLIIETLQEDPLRFRILLREAVQER